MAGGQLAGEHELLRGEVGANGGGHRGGVGGALGHDSEAKPEIQACIYDLPLTAPDPRPRPVWRVDRREIRLFAPVGAEAWVSQ
ncbi:hypothetical protein GCM10009610_12550 [Pseudonocardia xinjiangensis]